MAPAPDCSALANAMNNKGYSYAQVAKQVGESEQRVIDICTGKVTPTQSQFDAIASALDIRSPAPHTSSHATK